MFYVDDNDVQFLILFRFIYISLTINENNLKNKFKGHKIWIQILVIKHSLDSLNS